MVKINDVRLGLCCRDGNLMLYARKLIVYYASIPAGDLVGSVILSCRYPGWLVAIRRAKRVEEKIS